GISRHPSRAWAAWSSSVPALRDHDQPEPILCHSIGPPVPSASCSLARVSKAVCSPRRHLADLTNWNTATDQPWFQLRSASPKAEVDLPLPSPVLTITSGRLRRWRVVSPSSGMYAGCPLA